MVKPFAFAALVIGLFAPQGAVAQDARIAPVLSTSMQRVCQIETTRTLLMNGGRAVDNPRPSSSGRPAACRRLEPATAGCSCRFPGALQAI
jgi:hypothetical protein